MPRSQSHPANTSGYAVVVNEGSGVERAERMLTSPSRWKAILFFAFLLTFGSAGAVAQSMESQALEIIERRCLPCHSPELRTSGLDLSTPQTALQGGSAGPALKPGQPANSLLFKRVVQQQMPPGTLSLGKSERFSTDGSRKGQPGREESGKLAAGRVVQIWNGGHCDL